MKRNRKGIDIQLRVKEMMISLGIDDSGKGYATYQYNDGKIVKLDKDTIKNIISSLFGNSLLARRSIDGHNEDKK